MTLETESAEVYTAGDIGRSDDVSLDYDSETHTITVQSNSLDAHADNIQDALEEAGVYTRVESVDAIDGDHTVTVTLKPASSVELRDENGTLKKRPVSNPTDSSVITKRRGNYRYIATTPIATLDKAGIEHKDKVALYTEVQDGHLAFRVVPEDKPHSLVVRRDTTGLIRVPNIIGSAADIDGHAINWGFDVDGEFVSDVDVEDTDDPVPHDLVGITSVELPEVNTNESDTGRQFIVPIARKQQHVEREDGGEWDQEHFQTYIRNPHTQRLGWGDDELVDLRFARDSDNRLLFILSEDIRAGYDEKTPCVKRLNAYAKSKDADEGTQLNFYVPNDLVYAMGLVDKSLRWAVIEDETTLVGWSP